MKQMLQSDIDAVFSRPGLPKSVADELNEGDDHPENSFLYKSLKDVEWREVTSEMIESPYPSFFLLTDRLMAYYLPAVMKHIVVNEDVCALESLLRRIMRRRDGLERRAFCHKYDLNRKRERVFEAFIVWALKLPELEWKEVALIEDFLTV